MAEGCELLDVAEAASRAPQLSLDEAQAVLYSPHEMRVESRTAIGLLAGWLARSWASASTRRAPWTCEAAPSGWTWTRSMVNRVHPPA